jgi:hypothetical protein
MSTVAITHTVSTLIGVGIPSVQILCTLSEPGFRADDSEISRLHSFITDGAGAVSMSLERNVDVVPGGSDTYYTADVLIPQRYGGPKRYTFRATVAQSLHDSLVAI